MIPPRLLAAYRCTVYRFVDDGRWVDFRIGRADSALDRVLRRYRACSAAFLTAWNPLSRPQPALVNAVRERRLAAAARRGGWPVLPGEGADPAGLWPPERSLLILAIDRRSADRLAAAFGQNAYVWLQPRSDPSLVLCR
ncbi:MAG TPA: DUF3293 domain-containing protein [Alphaproteobacteria bacterium]|nr:DUF3293 domain-containing protein [Alphaproteobacteria bacterium]